MPDTYTTIQGDVWDIIAKKLWNNEKYMHKLIEANPEYRDVVVFKSGITLNVPEIEMPPDIVELPPWKK